MPPLIPPPRMVWFPNTHQGGYNMPNSNTTITIWTLGLYLSGAWADADLRTNTQKVTCLKEIGLHVQNMVTILD